MTEMSDWLIDNRIDLPPAVEIAVRAAHAAEVERVTAELQARVERLEDEKNTAYAERQKMVHALTFIFPSHMKRHPEADTEWEDDWRNIVCIHGPAGQMTWHIHNSEAQMFGHLNRKPDPFADCEYDGHTTPEKYDRLLESVLQRFRMRAADAAEPETQGESA